MGPNTAINAPPLPHSIHNNAMQFKVPRKLGIGLDMIFANIFIIASFDMGILDEDCSVMPEMEKNGIKPGDIIYMMHISPFYVIGQWETGNGRWNLIVGKDLYPNGICCRLQTFNAVNPVFDRGQAWKATDLPTLMKDLQVQPEKVANDLVITGFCWAGCFDMAERVYSAVHELGYKANL